MSTLEELKKELSKIKKELSKNIKYFGSMITLERFFKLFFQIHELDEQKKKSQGRIKEKLEEEITDLQVKLVKIQDKVLRQGKDPYLLMDTIESLFEKEVEIEESIKEKTNNKKKSVKKNKKMNKACINNSKTALKKHQKKLVEVLSTSQRGIIAIHSTGSGKTLTAITASQCFLKSNKDGKIIVITPKSLQGNFINEIQKYGAYIDDKYKFYTFGEFRNAMLNRRVFPCKNCMLIVDETHNLRTEGGTIPKPLIEYAKDAKKVLLLTATPIINNPFDISNLIAMIDGTEPMSKNDFGVMIKNEEYFKKYFSCKISMFSPSDDEIVEFYPKSIEKDVYIPMSSSYEKKYDKLQNDIGENINIGKKNLKVFYNGLRRGSNKLEDTEYSKKIEWIVNKIADSDNKDKFVVYSNFLDAGIKILARELYSKKISFKTIEGSLSKKKRNEVVEKYNANEFKVLLISKAGGEGLDLKETSHVILMEPNWNEAGNKQVIGRAVRFLSHINLPENKRKVYIHRLFLVRKNENKNIKKIFEDEEYFYKDKMISIDLIMKKFVIKKQKEIDDFLEKLSEYTIEKNDC
jgi:SNF2 family DNA or RNA helicase